MRALAAILATLTLTLLAAATAVATATPAGAAPIITQQPASETVQPGATATFTAQTSDSGAAVLWQFSTDGGATFAASSVTTPTLLVPSATIQENGNEYRATFTDSSGSIITNAAVLSVGNGAGDLIVFTEPTNQSATAGGTASFSAQATGDPAPTVEWETSADDGNTWSATGVTTTTDTVNATRSADYRAVFSNSTGTLATRAAILTVTGSTTTTTLPVATDGQPYSVALTASGGTAPYTWSLAPGSDPLPTGLALSPSGTISGTPNADAGITRVTVNVADSSNPPKLATEEVALTVRAATPCTSSGNVTFVCQAYVDVLGRSPAGSEISTWVNPLNAGTLSRIGVATAIASSPEYRAELVGSFFNAYLHRAAEASAVDAYSHALGGGMTDETLQSILLGSQEYFVHRGGGTTSGFVNALYKDLLSRVPQAAEVAHWQGGSRIDIAAGVLNSPEYKGDLIATDYLRFLGRHVDQAGLNAWISSMNGGTADEQVLAGIVGSQEFFNHA
jgi:hypothetical protein